MRGSMVRIECSVLSAMVFPLKKYLGVYFNKKFWFVIFYFKNNWGLGRIYRAC
ncbi:hypothetical protein [Moraxella lacunata]|uniref:hypothetical protein n=1 Tax=Moraxella lacunata TaxID=477 RepID=UPI003EE370DD